MSFDINKFSVFLRDLRENLMYKQVEVAEAIGVTVQTYGKYENGSREPGIGIIYRLANFFKISPILFFINEYPLKSEDYMENSFMILSIMASNYEKIKWLCKRYEEKNTYTNIGTWGNAKYIKKDEKNLMQIKSSLFRMHGDLLSLKDSLIKEIDEIKNETIDLIENLDKNI